MKQRKPGRPAMPDHLKKRVISPKVSPETADYLAALPWGEASPLVDELLTRHWLSVQQAEGRPRGTFECLFAYHTVGDLMQELELRRRDYNPETMQEDDGEHWTGAEAELHNLLSRLWDGLRRLELFWEPER